MEMGGQTDRGSGNTEVLRMKLSAISIAAQRRRDLLQTCLWGEAAFDSKQINSISPAYHLVIHFFLIHHSLLRQTGPVLLRPQDQSNPSKAHTDIQKSPRVI